jgi:hypothetical protein
VRSYSFDSQNPGVRLGSAAVDRHVTTRMTASGQERTYVVFDKMLNSRAREPPFQLVLRDQSEFVPDEIFRIQ